MSESERSSTDGVSGTTRAAKGNSANSSKEASHAFANVSELAEELTRAAPELLDQRATTYDHVTGLSIYWQDGDYFEMKENAEKIHQVLRGTYDYCVDLFPLLKVYEDPEAKLSEKLMSIRGDLDPKAKNLVILYYCGHGLYKDGKLLWQPKKRSIRSVDWGSVQTLLPNAYCDWLFVLDCCYALRMIIDGQGWKRRCEILGSTMPQDEANADINRSFTTFLCAELSDWGALGGVTVQELYWNLTNAKKMDEFRLDKAPGHRKHSFREQPFGISVVPKPTSLAKDASTESNGTARSSQAFRSAEQITSTSSTMMLIVAHLSDAAAASLMDIKHWQNMIQVSPQAIQRLDFVPASQTCLAKSTIDGVLRNVKVEGLYEGSCVAIITMPIWLWDCVQYSDAFHAIAVVQSRNLLRSTAKNLETFPSVDKCPSFSKWGKHRRNNSKFPSDKWQSYLKVRLDKGRKQSKLPSKTEEDMNRTITPAVPSTPPSVQPALFERIFIPAFHFIDKLPGFLGAFELIEDMSRNIIVQPALSTCASIPNPNFIDMFSGFLGAFKLTEDMSQTITAAVPSTPPSFQPTLFERIFIRVFHFVDLVVPWDKLPGFLGAFNLHFMRTELLANNLHDGYASGAAQGNRLSHPLEDRRFLTARNSDGKFNSLELPLMACSGMRFGRNFPREYTRKPTESELWSPNPRLVSERFMTRKPGGFIPATSLNLLAAAWIQFQVHDWFQHETSDEVYDIPLLSEDKWPGSSMTLPRTKPDETRDPSDIECPGYNNKNTAWWDGSQIYGSSEVVTQSLRTRDPDGKLILAEESMQAFLQRDIAGNPRTGFSDNWWTGMEMLHTLFAMEHNAICDTIRASHPDWTGDDIFDKARLINSALMAKIHTVEWTPAILAHPALQIGMNANWWGIVGETLTKILGRISTSETISGIPGSGVNHFGVPYSLTEEFVSVYRMHSLIPDNIAFFSVTDGKHKSTTPFVGTAFSKAQNPFHSGLSFADTIYSFGINYPGAITNNNYPNFMRNLSTPDGQFRDMGTVDILRDRERGVPRYNQFRRLLRMSAPKTFEELTGGNKERAQELCDVYGDVELVDTLVGSHSEPLPKGFGFSDTAFRIFILMASRCLKSDRFFAGQWNSDTYTKEGLHWVQNTGMKDVLVRHFPELEAPLKKTKNVFAPWEKLPESTKYEGAETNAPEL